MNNVCQVIALALIRLRDQRAVAPLVEMLSDRLPEVRRCAVAVLEDLGDQRAVEPLMALTEDSDPLVRDSSIRALGKLGDRRPAAWLLERLDREYDRTVAHALGDLREPRAVAPLLTYLAAAVQDHAGRGAIHSSAHHAAAWALAQIGDARALPVLIDMLDRDPSLYDGRATYDTARAVAARSLARLGDPRAVEPLVRMLRAADEYNRGEAALALGHLGDGRGVEALLGVLQDEDAGVREAVCDGLGLLGDRRAVEPLLRVLGDAEDGVRAHAAEALGRLADRRAVAPLVERLSDREGVRGSAAEALGAIGDREAVLPLIEALQDPEWWVVETAATALGHLEDERATESLMAMVTSLETQRQLRLAAIRALDRIGDGRARPALEWAREHDIAPNADAAGEALERLAHR
jgi:HEAT repeat protein